MFFTNWFSALRVKGLEHKQNPVKRWSIYLFIRFYINKIIYSNLEQIGIIVSKIMYRRM